jgi:uncharacterized membrane protein
MTELLLVLLVIIGILMLRSHSQRLAHLEKQVRELTAALAGSPSSVTDTASAGQEADATAEDAMATAKEATEPATADADRIAASTMPELGAEAAAGAIPPPQKTRESLESRIGARWAVWVGGLALALGGLFLVKYSIESGLLSPAVRLAFAAIFGLALIAAGDVIRRRSEPVLAGRFQNAMIPGVLTAAGVVALFGTTYAAHAIYGFIGPATAFVILAAVSLATLGLSLLHGQALAGFGLVASMTTPALVASTSPKPWTLFAYLIIAWIATTASARLRRWYVVPSVANILLSGWALLYVTFVTPAALLPPTLSTLVMLAGVIFVWPGRHAEARLPMHELEDAEAVLFADGGDAAETRHAPPDQVATATHLRSSPGAFLGREPLGMTMSAAIGASLVAIALVNNGIFGTLPFINADFAFAAIVAVVAAFGAGRLHGAWAAIISALAAAGGAACIALFLPSGPSVADTAASSSVYGTTVHIGLGLGAIFVLLGGAFLKRYGARERPFAALWSVLMAVTPLAVAVISYIGFGNWNRDWLHGLYGIGLALLLTGAAEWRHRRAADGGGLLTTNILAAGAFAGLVFALHTLFHDAWPTILLPIVGMACVLAARIRPWAVLPWTMVAALVIVLGRIAWQPTVVDPSELGTTPILNMLLAGYGIPAALAAWAAFELRGSADLRLRNTLQALASILVLLTVAILVRHAMNGGVLNDAALTLGEQSIYTLLAIGAASTLVALDLGTPSSVFRYGSMAAGMLSVALALVSHLLVLNPFVTGADTGAIPIFNLLLLAYLLPALAYGGAALQARNRRPVPYVAMLATAGAVMAFAWATLSVRRFWQGDYIPYWDGFLQGETYSYSVVWLVIGIALLGLGARFDARSLRIASAVLVLVAVIKVFLIDMAHLGGFLRALSFIGLGIVLIGIGLFYQKILTRKKAAE